MEELETIWRFAVTGFAVWRLAQLFLEGRLNPRDADDGEEDLVGGRFWARRVVDVACWISVWMSSQTTLWVVCGFAGVFLIWLSASAVSRLLVPVVTRGGDVSRVSSGDGMQARHG